MEKALLELKKRQRAVTALVKALDKVRKATASNDYTALFSEGQKAIKALEAAQGIEGLIGEAREKLQTLLKEASTALEQERALLAGRIARGLQEAGFWVEGNLPVLRAGPFALEFDFGTKPRVTVWLGPKKEKLAIAPLEAESLVAKVVELYKTLFAPIDEAAFLAELERAYRMCLARFLLPDNERVPITALMAELAFLRQDDKFRAEPKRENFRPLTRAEFAAALSMLKNLRLGQKVLRLEVASITQTRRIVDYLWVPRGRDGIHVSSVAFESVKLEEVAQ